MDFVSAYYWQQGENVSALLLQQCRLRDKTVFFACVCEGKGKRAGMAGSYLAERFLVWFRGFRLSKAVKSPERFLERHAGELEALVRELDGELVEAGVERLPGVRGSGTRISKAKRPGIKKWETGLLGTGGLPGRGLLGTEAAGAGLSETGMLETGAAGAGLAGTEEAWTAQVSFAGIFCLGEHFLLFGRGNAGIRLLNHGIRKTCVGNPIGCGEELQIKQGVMEPGIGLLLATNSFYRNVEEDAMREGLSVEEVLNGIQTEKHLRELGRAAERAGGGNMAAVLLYAREK